MDIYAQNILDRYKEPFYKDKPIEPTITGGLTNHSCGDKLKVQLELDGDTIRAYTFSGVGCAISQAAADILGDLIIDITVKEASSVTSDELLEALGIEISERRMKCALLGLNAIQEAIRKFTL